METNKKVVLHIVATVKMSELEAFKKIAAQTSIEALKEPYALSINMYQNPDNPQDIIIFEEWESRKYLLSDAHQKSEHISNFFQVASPMLEKPFEYGIYDVVSESKPASTSKQ